LNCGKMREEKTVVFMANSVSEVSGSRGPIIDRFLEKGWKVVVAGSLDSSAGELEEKGVVVEELNVKRKPFSPWKDFKTLCRILSIYRKYKPDLIHCFHIKPVVLGNVGKTLACRKAKLVNTITGLGYSFNVEGLTNRLARFAYRVSLSGCDVTIFQNPDDRDDFVKEGLIDEDKTEVILSSGVDPRKFVFSPETDNDKVKVLMATRLLWQKGIGEYVEAAEEIKEDREDVVFELAGGFEEEHMDGVDREWVVDKDEKGVIDFLGYVDDMVSKLAETDIVVLPSYYREGVPRVLLEAMASGKPIVTTDAPGCRETVVEGRNGILVEPEDSESLADAILELVDDKEKRTEMGKEGRSIVEEEFDRKNVVEEYFEVYKKIGIEL